MEGSTAAKLYKFKKALSFWDCLANYLILLFKPLTLYYDSFYSHTLEILQVF